MRHRAKGRQLSRTSTHKRALLNNMAASLFEHGRVVSIRDVTPIPHNGCRPPKKRRVERSVRSGHDP